MDPHQVFMKLQQITAKIKIIASKTPYFYHSIRLNTRFNINKQIQVPVNGSGRVSSYYIRHLSVLSRTYRPTTPCSCTTYIYPPYNHPHSQIATILNKNTPIFAYFAIFIYLCGRKGLKALQACSHLSMTYILAFAICS